MRFAPGNSGRPKGARNKLTAAYKDGLLYAFEHLGGAAGMAAWAVEHQTEFYKLISRLLPVEVRAELESPPAVLVIDRVSTRGELLAARGELDDDFIIPGETIEHDEPAETPPAGSVVPEPEPETAWDGGRPGVDWPHYT